MAELARRQYLALVDSTLAEKRAAEAEETTAAAAIVAAEASKTNAKYLLWSVVVAAISAVAAMVTAIVSLFNHPAVQH